MDKFNMQPSLPPNPTGLAEALRNFFRARNTADLREGIAGLAPFTEGAFLSTAIADVKEAEYAFNRLFVGPAAVPAPPYASVYLDEEPELMGASTVAVRDLLHELGLQTTREEQDPEDHIAVELEAWLVLQNFLRRDNLPAAAEEGLREAENWLVNEHMALWVPEFIRRAKAEADVPPAVAAALNCLALWLKQCTQRSAYE